MGSRNEIDINSSFSNTRAEVLLHRVRPWTRVWFRAGKIIDMPGLIVVGNIWDMVMGGDFLRLFSN